MWCVCGCLDIYRETIYIQISGVGGSMEFWLLLKAHVLAGVL